MIPTGAQLAFNERNSGYTTEPDEREISEVAAVVAVDVVQSGDDDDAVSVAGVSHVPYMYAAATPKQADAMWLIDCGTEAACVLRDRLAVSLDVLRASRTPQHRANACKWRATRGVIEGMSDSGMAAESS